MLDEILSFLKDCFDPMMQEYNPGPRNYGELPSELARQLEAVEPVGPPRYKMFPCRVELKDGRQVDKVVVMSAADFSTRYVAAPWPDDLAGGATISIDDVRRILPSENRVPPAVASKLHAGGETGMGFHRFAVRYADGAEETYWVPGDNLDFLELPAGRAASRIVDVFVHEKRGAEIRLPESAYQWCLFGHGKGTGTAWYGTGIKFKPAVPVRLVRSSQIRR